MRQSNVSSQRAPMAAAACPAGGALSGTGVQVEPGLYCRERYQGWTARAAAACVVAGFGAPLPVPARRLSSKFVIPCRYSRARKPEMPVKYVRSENVLATFWQQLPRDIGL